MASFDPWVCLNVCVCVYGYLCDCVSVCMSLSVWVRLSLNLFLCVSFTLCVCLCLVLSVTDSGWVCVCLSMCLSMCVSCVSVCVSLECLLSLHFVTSFPLWIIYWILHVQQKLIGGLWWCDEEGFVVTVKMLRINFFLWVFHRCSYEIVPIKSRVYSPFLITVPCEVGRNFSHLP